MTQLAAEILQVAATWRDACSTTIDVNNAGGCVDDIQRAFDGTSGNHQAYCTKFVWIVINQALSNLGILGASPKLPKTAGALQFLVLCRNVGFQIDQSPAIGSVFYHKSGSAGSTGHVGIVIDVTADGIRTMEGNNNQQTKEFPYTNTQWQNWRHDATHPIAFIHTELIGDTPDVGNSVSSEAGFGGILGLLLLGGFIYWVVTK